MDRRVVALVIGIDAYPAPVATLRGCGNDAEAVEGYLRGLVPAERLDLLVLRDAEATREGVATAIRTHLTTAGPDDTALLYYSGHGSQQRVTGGAEPDGLRETLVLHDSRTPDGHDLADTELGALVGDVASSGAHVLVVLDCCHSGSGTRSLDDADDTVARRAPIDPRERDVSDLIGGPGTDVTRGVSGWAAPRAPHVLLAACRAGETAKEATIDGRHQGVLSAALIGALTAAGPGVTYRELHRYVAARARGEVREQNPQLETATAADLDRTVLGGLAAGRRGEFVLSFTDGTGWTIDAGAIHGIPVPNGPATVQLDVFPVPDGDRVATAGVVRVEPGRSVVTVAGDLDAGRPYRARITSTPVAPIGLALSGPGAAGLRSALAAATPTPGLLAEVADASAVLFADTTDGLVLRRPAASRPEIGRFADDEDGRRNAAAALVLAANWLRVAALRNPASGLAEDAVRIEVELARAVEGRWVVAYDDPADGTRVPGWGLRLTNTTGTRLWASVLDLTEDYGVYADAVPDGAVELPPQGQVAIRLTGEVSDDAWRAGISQAEDLIRVIVSTDGFDPRPLAQDGLGEASDGLRRVRPAGDPPRADWRVSDLVLTTIRPQLGVAVPAPGGAPARLGLITVEAHPSLQADVTLMSAADATRDADVPAAPPVLRELADSVVALDLGGLRDVTGPQDTLVLANVNQASAVTAADPLRFRLPGSLDADDHVLPLAWDGEFYLPLGYAVRDGEDTVVVLERLPEPRRAEQPSPGDPDQRSLTGSIRILFRKIVGRRIGLPYAYPLLRRATVVGTELTYADVGSVPTATSVLVYVHGIIGDTRGMATSSGATAVVPPPHLVGTDYDVVLTYDYENLDTSIRENGRLLGERLAAAGIAKGSGHTVDIVAHSMGGLVSRWFIEYAGGHDVVRHLVTVGTPNGGSPWPNVQRFATVALAAAVNGMAGVGWPLAALSSVLAGVEKVDTALDEMQPGSPLLDDLLGAPDPGVPYTVIIGDHHVPGGDAPTGRWARLLSRLSPRRVIGDVADLAFFGRPNDLAVSLTSGHHLPDGRSPAPRLVATITCDHVSYFATSAGLAAVAQALAP